MQRSRHINFLQIGKGNNRDLIKISDNRSASDEGRGRYSATPKNLDDELSLRAYISLIRPLISRILLLQNFSAVVPI